MKTLIVLGVAVAVAVFNLEAGMPLLQDPATSNAALRAALERKLADIDARIAGLAEPPEACPLRTPPLSVPA